MSEGREALRALHAVRAYIASEGSSLSVGQKLALEHYAFRADEHGITFLSLPRLARECGTDKGSARHFRRALLERGPLEITEEVPGEAPMLWINLPGLDGDTADSWRRRRKGRPPHKRGGVSNQDRGGVQPVPPGVSNDERGGVSNDETRSPIDPPVDPAEDPPVLSASSSSGNGRSNEDPTSAGDPTSDEDPMAVRPDRPPAELEPELERIRRLARKGAA